MKNLQKMMQEAQKIQVRITEIKEELARCEVSGISGGGMVEVIMNGKSEVKNIKIDPGIAGDVEIIEDLIVAACADAKTKVEAMMKEKMSELTGGLPLLSGLSLPF